MNLSQTIEAARNVLRFKHMAYKTEKSYLGWIRRYAYWCRENQGGAFRSSTITCWPHSSCPTYRLYAFTQFATIAA